jgi:hypothetical protein
MRQKEVRPVTGSRRIAKLSTMAARGVVVLIAVATVLLTPPGSASGDSSFDVNGLVNIRFTLPEEVLGFEVHATCIMRLDEGGGSGGSTPVDARAVCYQVATTDPAVPPPPPPPYASLVFPVLIEVSGQLDESTGDLTLESDECIVVPSGQPPVDTGITFGFSAVAAKISGLASGSADVTLDSTPPLDCNDGAVSSQPFTKLNNLSLDHDGDIDDEGERPDSCPSWDELGSDEEAGGMRDPFNPWDYMNPTKDGLNRVDDILAVVNQYFIDANDPAYTDQTDRTSLIPGPNAWNLGPPNGQQRVDDILNAVKSYFHDCSPAA